MDFDSTKRLRTSNSRNFSRPFPSPVSTGALTTPIKPSKDRDFLARTPFSASRDNAFNSLTSQNSLATNRLIDFAVTPQTSLAAGNISHSNGKTCRNTSDNKATLCGAYSHSSSSANYSVDHDLGVTSPILNFRPNLWRILERDRHVLNLDLFWPTKLDKSPDQADEQAQAKLQDEEPAGFPYEDLKPLLTFRNLHVLQLNGMMRSYQPLIWATCWLNPNLTTLHLEMALEPLINISSDISHRQIDANWSLNPMRSQDDELEYLGVHGTGVLHEEFGDGEYLDMQAIKMAQLDVAEDVPSSNIRYLPVKKLTLMNFVLDGIPILRWFDPNKFEEVVFKPGCIDVGFYLSDEMKHVKIQAPKPPVSVVRVIKPGELKIVELKKGKVVSRKDVLTGKEELNIMPPTLKHKISQLLPRMASKSKDDRAPQETDKNKENKASIDHHGGGNIGDLETGFSEMEIRAAKDGKRPAR